MLSPGEVMSDPMDGEVADRGGGEDRPHARGREPAEMKEVAPFR